MKKILKILKNTSIVIIILIVILLLDALQSKLLNNSPIIHRREEYNINGIKYKDKGIITVRYIYYDYHTEVVYIWTNRPLTILKKFKNSRIKKYI